MSTLNRKTIFRPQASPLRGLPSGPDGAQPGVELRGEKWASCWEKRSRDVRCRSNASAIPGSLPPTALSHPCGLRADVEAEHNSECCPQHWWSGNVGFWKCVISIRSKPINCIRIKEVSDSKLHYWLNISDICIDEITVFVLNAINILVRKPLMCFYIETICNNKAWHTKDFMSRARYMLVIC